MSHYLEIETNVCDQDALVRALGRVGFEGQVEVHETAQALYGYRGDRRKQKAHVIVRREHVGSASNDIGFERMPSGKFKSHISEYDTNSAGYDEEWQERLYTYYGVEKAKQEYEVRNIKYTEDVDEKERPRLRAFL